MNKTIKNKYLSRVEGEGGFNIEIRDGKISKHQLNIFEAPRFFESFLIGRNYVDIPDFTSRICGICPVAYLMTSIHALEKIFGIETDYSIKELRRLLYASEWLSSHALHVYMLHGPDFYNLPDCWSNKDYIELTKRGLRFKKIGNQIAEIIGGRSIHPVSVKVGCFYRFPNKKDLIALLPDLESAYKESLIAIKWASGLDFKESPISDIEFISLRHDRDYPMNEGYVLSNKDINLSMEKFFNLIQEFQVQHSTALQAGIKREQNLTPYLTGPIARLNLNYDRLPNEIRQTLMETGIKLPLENIHMGIIARSVEIAYCIYEAIRIIKAYEDSENRDKQYTIRAGDALWITEAPRGMLLHRYEIDEKGQVKACTIIPPTSQNLLHIECSIYKYVEANIDMPADYLKKECDKIIRSYDPCISCATHIIYL